jgi:hypothetical protein
MKRRSERSLVQRAAMAAGIATVAMLTAGGGVWAQGGLTARIDPSGLITVSRGAVEVAMIELSAHGPGWVHAPQESATASFAQAPGSGARRITGSLPIPGSDGGAIDYTQTVSALPQGLRVRYELAMTKAMRLNGLHLSILLPVETHAGSEVMISQPHGDPDIAGLPEEQPEAGSAQLWTGSGSLVEVGKGAADMVTAQLRAATDVIIQDLRQWEHEIFEVRFPAIMDGEGRDVSAEDGFHLDITIGFNAPLTVEGP